MTLSRTGFLGIEATYPETDNNFDCPQGIEMEKFCQI
jgi:hypothetical protein